MDTSLDRFMKEQLRRIRHSRNELDARRKRRQVAARRDMLAEMEYSVIGGCVTNAMGEAKPTLSQLDHDAAEFGR